MSSQNNMDAESLRYIATMQDGEFTKLRARLKSLGQIYMELAIEAQKSMPSDHAR